MHIHLPALSGIVLTYLLVFSRVGAMVMLLPGIGTMGVPARVRLVLALAIALALTPTVQNQLSRRAPQTMIALVILIAQEITAGVLVGAMAAIIMSALQVAGFLIASQIGLSYAQTIDPTQNTQGAVVGNFLTLLGTVLIFATDLHHLAIGAIAGSYRMLPPGGHLPTSDMAQLVIRLVSVVLRAGLPAGRALPGVRLRGLCRAGRAGAADAATADFLCRGADQHSVRLCHHAGDAGLDDHAVPQLLHHLDGDVPRNAPLARP